MAKGTPAPNKIDPTTDKGKRELTTALRDVYNRMPRTVNFDEEAKKMQTIIQASTGIKADRSQFKAYIKAKNTQDRGEARESLLDDIAKKYEKQQAKQTSPDIADDVNKTKKVAKALMKQIEALGKKLKQFTVSKGKASAEQGKRVSTAQSLPPVVTPGRAQQHKKEQSTTGPQKGGIGV